MHDLSESMTTNMAASSSSSSLNPSKTSAHLTSSSFDNKNIGGLMENPDPRVQLELENLNTSTEFINKLELELEKARTEFNNLLSESAIKIESLSKKLGNSIQKARPYYEARAAATELHRKAQKEALRYEQATAEHNNAKEIVHLAEKTLQENGDTELEQLLTKSAEKVNQAELERSAAEKQHRITSREYSLTEQKLNKLHNQLKRSIVKASMESRRNFLELNNYANQHRLQLLPYFEMKAQFNQMLDEQVNKIRSYEARVNKAKKNYTKALQRLEELNNKIYDQQQQQRTNISQDETSTNSQETELNCRDSNPDGEESISVDPQRSNIGLETNSNIKDQNEKDSLVTTTPKTLPPLDEAIFDHPTLDQLVLEDQLDSNLDRLKNECLGNSSNNNNIKED